MFQPKELGKDRKFKEVSKNNVKIKSLLHQMYVNSSTQSGD